MKTIHSDELLSFSAVTKTYDGNEVLGGVDFQVCRGDRIGILGPSGVGKSTLLKIISGIVAPTSGTVTSRHNALAMFFRNLACCHGKLLVKISPWG